MISQNYPVPKRGLGTDFAKSERPLSFAEGLRNRFININSAAEKRPGYSQYGDTVSGSPNLTRIHEFVGKTGEEIIFSSDNLGNIYKLNETTGAWTTVVTGKTSGNIILSVQANGKLIFYNGVDRNFYTEDGSTFHELVSIINRGKTTSGTTTTTLQDALVSAWTTETNIAVNDIVYNVDCSAYAVVVAVSGSQVTHTNIGVSATGAGLSTTNQTTNQTYRIIDAVDLNVIPVDTGTDNVATAAAGTTTTVVAVSGVNFSSTEIRAGDFVRNTTRNTIALVTSVSANINVTTTTGQTSGDALVFLKSAMPITKAAHVNFGRVAYLDARNQNRIVWSAPDDPEDLTTFAKTLDSSSFNFGGLQPRGDILLGMGTFQSFFVALGQKYIYIYRGIDPIKDTSSDTISFEPVAAYPNGCAGRFGFATNGNDFVYVSPDGLLGISVTNYSQNTNQNNLGIFIRSAIRQAIANAASDDIQVTFYPRRTWIIVKVGDTIYNYNNTPIFNDAGTIESAGSWSTFDGPLAQMNHYFVRRNGDLLGCGLNGKLYRIDNGSYTDNGTVIPTSLETAWYTLEEPAKTVRVKDGRYIKPVFESGGAIVYSIRADAGWTNIAADTATVTATGAGIIGQAVVGQSQIGGSGVQTEKVGLRWRGEQVKLTITTESSAGPDVITGWTLYGNIFGRR